MNVEKISRIVYELNKHYCEALGDFSREPWEYITSHERESVRLGVQNCIENPDILPAISHECWLEHKRLQGWKYGPVKDIELREHPCLVPFDELSSEQQFKDLLFTTTVNLLSKVL
jgi:hypothetical protein